MNDKQQVFVCECQSLGHVYSFWFDPEEGELWWHVTLPNHKNALQRIWRALGYIVGKRPRFGDYDGMIVSPDDLGKLKETFDQVDAAVWLRSHPKVKEAGMGLWEDSMNLLTWLGQPTLHSMKWGLTKRGNSYTRVMDMDEKEILDEIGRIEHGVF